MVKLFAPAMALDADGTVGKAMTFSKWKGRHYLRKHSTPANPRSGLQVGVRAMFKFLTENWSALDASAKATWLTLAANSNLSNFNAYVGANTLRWKRFQGPSQDSAFAEFGDTGTYDEGQPSAEDGVASITINWNIDDSINDNWGIMIFRGTTGFSTALSNCVAIVLSDVAATPYSWLDSPLTPGTYYYSTRLFTNDGILDPQEAEINATAD